jgi:hypothetical protein
MGGAATQTIREEKCAARWVRLGTRRADESGNDTLYWTYNYVRMGRMSMRLDEFILDFD